MSKPPDDLDAIRTIVSTLEAFEVGDRERIIRYALEKLGVKATPLPSALPVRSDAPSLTPQSLTVKNISTFVKDKDPKSDVQFAATVSYFHRFEAPTDKRKDEINADDLLEACRLVPWTRPKNPGQTLRNAKFQGLLDAGTKDGFFCINSVGENLVAMALPGGAVEKDSRRKKRARRKVKKIRKTSKNKK
jgi:hypothetical protein